MFFNSYVKKLYFATVFIKKSKFFMWNILKQKRKMNYKYFRFLFACFMLISGTIILKAQDSTAMKSDSITFESQRARVNRLLNERSVKFGDYDSSLTKKTGVFGLFKTKGDMQKSIDILRNIVINDNHIFIETRKLLDLKDAQSERYQKLAAEYDQQISAYMKTINKLQQENDKLRGDISNLENSDQGNDNKLFIAILIILGLVISVIYLYLKQKSKKLTV